MIDNKIIDKRYEHLISDLKERVTVSRHRAALSVNREMILLYHYIGQKILSSQEQHGWGSKVIDRLSRDLIHAFPDIKGFSPRNLKYMRKFAEEYHDVTIVQQLAAQLPWGHNMMIMDKIEDYKTRCFYMERAIAQRWSRNVMVDQIEKQLHDREGKAITNFEDTLPSSSSGVADNVLKDPYIFDFLGLSNSAQERDVEHALINHMQKFLLELGDGFSFVGRQYHLSVGGQDFYIDLLFYHLKLRCFVVIELKDKAFKPEYTGKLNFYLSAVDDLVKHESDNPSIGLIL